MRWISFILLFFSFAIQAQQNAELVLPDGINGTIYNVALSPNGKLLATGTSKGQVKIWDTYTQLQLAELPVQKQMILKLFFAPDNRKLVVKCIDGVLFIWDIIANKKINTPANWEGYLPGSFTPDSKGLYCIYQDAVYLLNIASGKIKLIIKADKRELRMLRLSPNGNFMALKKDAEIVVWDLKMEKQLFAAKGTSTYDHYDNFTFTKTGRSVLFSIDDGIEQWDIASSTKQFFYYTNTTTELLLLSVDDNSFLTYAPDSKLLSWKLGVQNAVDQKEIPFYVKTMASDESGKIVAIAKSYEPEVLLMNLSPWKETGRIGGHSLPIQSINISADENTLLIGNRKYAKTWDLSKMKGIESIATSQMFMFDAHFSPDATLFCLASYKKLLPVYNTAAGKVIYQLTHDTSISAICFSQDNKLLAAGTVTGTIYLWNLQSGALVRKLKDRADYIEKLAFSTDSKLLASSAWLPLVELWELPSGKKLNEYMGNRGPLSSLFFTKNNRGIITSGQDSIFREWDISGNKEPDKYANIRQIKSAAISFNKNMLVCGGPEGQIDILDQQNGTILKSIKPHTSTVQSIVIDNQKNQIITASLDNTIKFLDANTGAEKATLILIDSTDYFIKLPDNTYSSTRNALKLLSFRIKDKVYPFEQLDTKYNRPDKVLKALGNLDTALISSYYRAYVKRMKKLGIDTLAFKNDFSVPQAVITNIEKINLIQTNDKLVLQIHCLDAANKLDRFNLWINEVPVYGMRGISLRKKNKNSFDTSLTIILSKGENRIETSVINNNGIESYRSPFFVNYQAQKPTPERLYFVGIGIDRFADSSHNLNWSVKDIRDLAISFKKRYGNNVLIDTLFNKEVSIDNVLALKKHLSQSSVNDKLIIAYSGHGLLSSDYDYYLSTYQVNFSQPAINGLPFEMLESLADDIPCRKKLLLIDACHSGEVDKEEMAAMQRVEKGLDSAGIISKGNVLLQPDGNKRVGMKNSFALMQELFVNVSRSTGATVISAAAGTQFALEQSSLKNGVFTYSILELMQQQESATVYELKTYVNTRVTELTRGLQVPTTRAETSVINWNVW